MSTEKQNIYKKENDARRKRTFSVFGATQPKNNLYFAKAMEVMCILRKHLVQPFENKFKLINKNKAIHFVIYL